MLLSAVPCASCLLAVAWRVRAAAVGAAVGSSASAFERTGPDQSLLRRCVSVRVYQVKASTSDTFVYQRSACMFRICEQRGGAHTEGCAVDAVDGPVVQYLQGNGGVSRLGRAPHPTYPLHWEQLGLYR